MQDLEMTSEGRLLCFGSGRMFDVLLGCFHHMMLRMFMMPMGKMGIMNMRDYDRLCRDARQPSRDVQRPCGDARQLFDDAPRLGVM